MILLIDGWYDLHKTTNKEQDSFLWPISYSKFIEMLCPNIAKDIYRSSYYHTQVNMDFSGLKKYLLCEEFKEQHLKILENYVLNGQKMECLDTIRKHLISLLNETTAHNPLLCKRIIDEFETITTINEWKQCLYHYIHFAITDRLHKDMALNTYSGLSDDLLEYNKKVTMSYGTSGYPGMLQLYSLASRKTPNIIALYELGELEYYGKGPSGKINYNNAYMYYLKTLKLSNSHPLALWSIAYMKYHYGKKGSGLKYGTVPKLDEECINGKKRFWYEDIINKVDQSYAYGCSAAANLIGQIILSSEEDFPERYKGKYKYEHAEKYFRESADSGYIYGCNNYATYCAKEALNTQSLDKKYRLMEESINYLMQSANNREPWASNKLGTYYLSGYSIDNKNLLIQDYEIAYQYFSNAIIMSASRQYYWPLINLCKYFYLNKSSKHYGEKTPEELKGLIKDALDNLDIDLHKDQIEILNELYDFMIS